MTAVPSRRNSGLEATEKWPGSAPCNSKTLRMDSQVQTGTVLFFHDQLGPGDSSGDLGGNRLDIRKSGSPLRPEACRP